MDPASIALSEDSYLHHPTLQNAEKARNIDNLGLQDVDQALYFGFLDISPFPLLKP